MTHATAPNILIIDDCAMVTGALSNILQREGYDTTVFNCGAEALDYVQNNAPAAAVVDIHLPDISGLVISSKLRARFGDGMPIILLSGDTSMENLRSLSHVGATYFIGKPFQVDHLLERLRELVVA